MKEAYVGIDFDEVTVSKVLEVFKSSPQRMQMKTSKASAIISNSFKNRIG